MPDAPELLVQILNKFAPTHLLLGLAIVAHSTLPFHTCPELDTTVASDVDKTTIDEIHEILNSNNNQLKVMRLNTQSMMSTFNEF